MKSIKSIFLIGAVSLAMTSCLDNGKDEQWTSVALPSSDNLTYVVNLDNYADKIESGADYNIKYIISSGKADFSVRNLSLGEGGELSFTISGLAFSYGEDGRVVISANSVLDDNNNHTISNLNVVRWERYLGSVLSPITSISFVVDGKYHVRAMQKNVTLLGKTQVITSNDGVQTIKESSTPTYGYTLEKDGKATFYVANIELFDQNFSRLALKNMEYSVTSSGITFKGQEAMTPTFIPDPVENFTIDDFIATQNLNFGIAVGFNIGEDTRVSASASVLPQK